MSIELQRYTHQLKAMGSRCEFQFYAQDKKAAEEYFSAAIFRLNQLEQKYSRYREDSVTFQINNAAGSNHLVKVDDETAGLLNYAETLYHQSDGLFDITSGILRQAWDFRSGSLPSREHVDNLLPLIGWDKVRWNTPHFYLTKQSMEIDFGGYVKEYAADQIAQLLIRKGLQHGFINLGGDIVVVGPHPDGSPWIVGIQHPRKANQAIVQIPLERGAIATSGDYERYMIVDGKRYCHLLNPRSGEPVQSVYASVSVITEQCLISGSFSSLAMLKGEDDANWIEGAGVSYLAVNKQLEINSNIDQK